MMTLVAIVHVIVALVLIVLVLIQDSKSDGALGMGGSSNANSILGATGAQTLAAKLTVAAAVIFALTCLGLTFFGSKANRSVVDSLPLPTAPATAGVPATPGTPTVPENAATQGAAAAPAASPAASASPTASPAAAPATK